MSLGFIYEAEVFFERPCADILEISKGNQWDMLLTFSTRQDRTE